MEENSLSFRKLKISQITELFTDRSIQKDAYRRNNEFLFLLQYLIPEHANSLPSTQGP